ncbi:MAG: hypothetical protein K0S33_3638 [Bacteroidetes bacterium]|jgi:hypothetical protein|nr:hypothetical protein [Bacteroidota bacterium]
MKTNNPIIDNILDVQSQTINNWIESTQKFQKAFTGGSIAQEGQHIYKDWMDKQTTLFNGMQANQAADATSFGKPEEFFKNWYTQQMDGIKKMTDFNQSIYSSFANYGKPANEYINHFTGANTAWTNIYNNWMNTLNNSYSTFMKNIPNSTNQDAFKNMFETSQMYLKLQEFWQPAFKSFQSGDFSADTFKTYLKPEAYKQLTEQMFGNMFNTANMKDVFDASIKKIQEFFSTNNNLSKEYVAQMQSIAKNFPGLISGDFAKVSELYNNVNNVFGKTFEPLMKLATPGKEKETIEANIALLDKISEYSVKQTEMQYHFYVTAQKAMEAAAQKAFAKMDPSKTNEIQGFNEFYNEWIKTNEDFYTTLFASDEFSKIKGEVTNIGMDVKSHFEKQFENVFGVYPVAFRSEVDELTKTIHDLKKQVKALETRLAAMGAANVELDEEDKQSRKKK